MKPRSKTPVTAVPGAVVAIQTFGDLLGFNPHLHVLVSDGCFHQSGMLTVAPAIDTHAIEKLFVHKVLKLLVSKGRITEATVAMMASWRHSGFNVHCGPRILPHQADAMENLARYIIRASFSQERLSYDAPSATVVYHSKDGSREKTFDALEWLAAMCVHVPDKGEQMVRYYGYYSNVARGKRQKAGCDNAEAYVLEPQLTDKAFRKSWARLIQKIYEVDPLVCPACGGAMRVIAFIEDQDVIRKILTHLNLWQIKPRLRPVAHGPPDITYQPFCDVPASWADGYQADPVYPDEAYF